LPIYTQKFISPSPQKSRYSRGGELIAGWKPFLHAVPGNFVTRRPIKPVGDFIVYKDVQSDRHDSLIRGEPLNRKQSLSTVTTVPKSRRNLKIKYVRCLNFL
jgi:hypothetical protein